MAVEDDDDRATLLVDFGVVVTIGSATPTVIFDAAYFEDGIGEGPGADSSRPAALGRTSDLSSVAIDTSVVIAGTTYKVTSVQPDGHGWTVLILEKQ